jgi:hypothetical protein
VVIFEVCVFRSGAIFRTLFLHSISDLGSVFRCKKCEGIWGGRFLGRTTGGYLRGRRGPTAFGLPGSSLVRKPLDDLLLWRSV